MNIWDQLVDCICRPPRDVYKPTELLGGSNQTFMIGAMECTRLDYELVGRQGMKLQCSHYFPLDAKSQDDKLPVVVYCHCNSGSRRDAEEAIYHLLPCGVGVVAFDFTGSGLSDGKWVTLGALEVEDLAVVVKHLRSQGGISSIGLWGRSMGAVTALLYSHLDPDIAGMVLDSPFSRLTDLMLEIVVSQRLPIPKVMLKLALRLMRNSVKRKAGCDINTVSPLDVVPRSAIPAMFGHGEEDSFINIQHSVKLYEAYNSTADAPVYKNLVRFKGDHNHPRPAFFYSSVCCFFHQQLKLDQVLLGGNPADTQQLMKYGSLALSSAYADHLDRANGFINTPWSLEPVSGLSPEDQAAAAAAAALLADEPAGLNGSASNGSGGGGGSGSAHAGHGSSAAGGAAAGNIGLGGLTSLPRIAVPAAHITEGGLNSPRRRDAGQTLVPGDACASSSGSSGGGRHAGRAPGMGRSPQDASDGQQQLCLSGAGSPISPLRHHQQQQHRERHQHHHHQQRHHHQQQSLSPRPAAAVSVPGVRPASTGDELFAVGSRGAPAAVLAAHETLEGSRDGAGAAAAGLGDSRGSGGSFGAAGEHFSKWFKRSSTSGSTPSTSPPVAASEGGGMLRPRSSGSGHAGSSRQEQGAGASAARPAGGVAMQTSPLAAAVVHLHPPQQQQQQQQQQHDMQGSLQLSGTPPASGSRGAGAAAVGPGVLQSGGGAGGGAVPHSVDEEEQMLQAAIALSLAESSQQKQEQQRPAAAVAAP